MIRWQADVEATATRMERVRAYLGKNVLNGHGFVCAHAAACKASHEGRGVFYEGQLHHIGDHYDVYRDGRPLRVVVVGQECGHGPGHIGLDARRQLILRRIEDTQSQRNPHMAGTTTILRLLFGREPGSDRDGEFLDLSGNQVHLFEAFALVNFLLCSAIEMERADRRDGGKGRSTPTMRRNCGAHFRSVIDLLEPTILVAEGLGVRRWIGDAYGWPTWNREPVQQVRLGDRPILLLSFAHPAAPGHGWWGRGIHSRYLTTTVKPTIERALEFLQ